MPDSLLPGDGQDLIARFKNARQKRNPDKMLELFAEDAEYRYHPFEPALIGANAIREYWNRVAAEQTHVDFDAERTWVAGNTVFSSWHSAHTLELTAERVRERGFSTAELDEDGQITRLRDWPTYKSIGVDSRHHPDPLPQEAGE